MPWKPKEKGAAAGACELYQACESIWLEERTTVVDDDTIESRGEPSSEPDCVSRTLARFRKAGVPDYLLSIGSEALIRGPKGEEIPLLPSTTPHERVLRILGALQGAAIKAARDSEARRAGRSDDKYAKRRAKILTLLAIKFPTWKVQQLTPTTLGPMFRYVRSEGVDVHSIGAFEKILRRHLQSPASAA
jgi:hypothetical protein